LVFIATLRPFIEIDVSSKVSGSDLRGFAREDVIFPNTFVPACNRTAPLTLTSPLIFAAKLLPAGSCDEMELTVCTASVVPAGIVAAVKVEIAKHAQIVAKAVMNWFRLIFSLTDCH